MPWTKTKISSGKYKGRYRITSPSGVRAKHATASNAAAQLRLLRAIEHNPNFKPRK